MTLALGVDIGTSSLKLGAVDLERGEFLGWAGSDYQLQHPRPGWSELDAEHYWRAFVESLRQLGKTVDLKAIRAISVSSQGQTFVPVDRAGNLLQRAWTWIDGRANEEAAAIMEQFPGRIFFDTVGVEAVSAGCLCAMLKYLRKNDPDVFSRTWKFLVTNSFLIWRLTGRTVIDENSAAISGLYDWHRRRWWPEMLAAVGVEDDRLPEVLPSGTVAGQVMPAVAKELGLSAETQIVTGANDQTANALGAGLVDEKELLIVLGTALIVFKVLGPHDTPCPRGFWNPYPVPGKTYQLGYTNSGCGTLDWARQLLAPECAYPDLFARCAAVPIGSDGVTCLIDLDGIAGTRGSAYRGLFAGLSRRSNRDSLLRSVLEGVACGVRELAEQLRWDLAGKDIRAVGGGARSDLWLGIHANVLNGTLRRLGHEQSGVVGGAVMAAVGARLVASYPEAVARVVKLSQGFSPDPAQCREYAGVYERFARLRKSGDLFYGVSHT